jgi:hypothetical protein
LREKELTMMESNRKMGKKKRIQEIEDRKIEILMEIARINRNYDEQVSKLNSEYERLHKELYKLQMEMITKKYQFHI